MTARCFVDTNVLVYAHDTSAGQKREVAAALTERLWHDASACVSVQVLQELYVTLQRTVRSIAPSTARELVSLYGRWRTFRPTEADVLAAIDLHQEHRLSFWDAMIVISAARLGCDSIYSEDLNAGQLIHGVEVIDPFSAGA